MVSADVVAAVSPHLDDAVLSCGHVLAASPGSHVVTVFSGGPTRVWRLPAWDRSSGIFSPGANVMRVRRAEDDAALDLLGARACRLDFWDSQYRDRPSFIEWLIGRRRDPAAGDARLLEELVERLGRLVGELEIRRWLVPLGLVHRDHLLTAEVCRRVARVAPDIEWVAYEEQPYGAERPDLAAEALSRLSDAGWRVSPLSLDSTFGEDGKRAAVERYRSQGAALGSRRDVALAAPEVYHRLYPPTPGAET